MITASPRGIRRVPLGRSAIHRTIGDRMYAMSPANTNGNSTEWPMIAMRRTNSGNAQRPRNVHTVVGALPNQVSRVRTRVGPDSGGGVSVGDIGCLYQNWRAEAGY